MSFPKRSTVPSKTASPPSSRPAVIGSWFVAYFRTDEVGRTTSRFTLLNLVIRASAIPSARYGPLSSEPIVLKGNTASFSPPSGLRALPYHTHPPAIASARRAAKDNLHRSGVLCAGPVGDGPAACDSAAPGHSTTGSLTGAVQI